MFDDYYMEEDVVTHDRTCYSFCISSSSLVFGYMLLLTVDIVREKQSTNRFYHCDITLKYCTLFGYCFMLFGLMRLLFIFAAAMPIKKIGFVIEIFHNKMRQVEILAGLCFMILGSCLLMIKEHCYELNLIFMLVLLFTAFLVAWVCCEDFEPDDILEENLIDN
ncbi:hypothetical protein pb186bvf_004296 [Paramecium bursaria]